MNIDTNCNLLDKYQNNTKWLNGEKFKFFFLNLVIFISYSKKINK